MKTQDKAVAAQDKAMAAASVPADTGIIPSIATMERDIRWHNDLPNAEDVAKLSNESLLVLSADMEARGTSLRNRSLMLVAVRCIALTDDTERNAFEQSAVEKLVALQGANKTKEQKAAMLQNIRGTLAAAQFAVENPKVAGVSLSTIQQALPKLTKAGSKATMLRFLETKPSQVAVKAKIAEINKKQADTRESDLKEKLAKVESERRAALTEQERKAEDAKHNQDKADLEKREAAAKSSPMCSAVQVKLKLLLAELDKATKEPLYSELQIVCFQDFAAVAKLLLKVSISSKTDNNGKTSYSLQSL